MNNKRLAAVGLMAIAGLLVWWYSSRARGAPAGSLANDPHTQSLLMQDINARRDSAAGRDTGSYAGNAPGVLTIEITKDCSHYGTCP